MDPEVQEWFSHVANVIGELRMEIRRMHANRQPPSRFGMRVRSHPDALIVTALNKMRNAQEVEVDISYSACGAETPFLPRDTEISKRNLALVNQFLSGLAPAEMIKNKCFWRNVPASQIAAFLGNLDISSMNMPFMPDINGRDRPILSFIGGNGVEKLAKWDICLPQGEGTPISELSIRSLDGSVRCISPRKRQFEKVRAGADYLKLNKQRVGEIADETVDLSHDDIENAKIEWDKERATDPKKGETIPGSVYRRYRKRPLLTIHLIEPRDPADGSKHKERMMPAAEIGSRVLVAIGLSFPKFEDGNKDARVPYRLNKVALRSMGLLTDQEDDDDED